MTNNSKTPPIQLKLSKRPCRRPSKPAAAAPHEVRRCILIDCESEATQRELFERLQQQGATCRLLTL